MGVRKTHNRYKDTDFMSNDINETIKKAKAHFKGEREFYIFKVLNTYYAQRDTIISKNPIKHFINQARPNERSKWEEEGAEQ